MSERSWAPETIVVEAARPPRETGEPVSPGIELSSTFFSAGDFQPGAPVYARTTNRSWEGFEDAIAQLEAAGEPGVVFSSGMAAISAALDLLAPGGILIMPVHCYNGTLAAARHAQRLGRLRIVFVDIADTQAVIAALNEATASAAEAPPSAAAQLAPVLLWVESPTNPMLEVADLPAIIDAGRDAGALIVADNTFATPLLQQPLEMGADVVVHSATKYLAGHSDVVLGIAVTSNPTLREQLAATRTRNGAIAGPFETWLALRGLRTLAVRVERAGENAMELAIRLTDVADIEVRYPGLPTDSGNEQAAAQMSGFGAIIAIELPDAAAADAFVAALDLITPATSLGGVETLAERRRRIPDEPQTVPAGLVRLSIGIEDVDDLWSDLSQALEVALP